MDRLALSDALYAERIAAGLRDSTGFRNARPLVTADILDDYVRARAESIRLSLSGSDADVQWAFDEARKRDAGADPTNRPRRVVDLLITNARSLLRSQGREMLLRVDRAEPGREILLWRFVSLAVPPGILIAAATTPGSLPASSVRLLQPSMAPDGPVAQQHVHHAAMVSFEQLWAGLRLRVLFDMAGLISSLRDKRAFCPGLHPGDCVAARDAPKGSRSEKLRFMRAKHLSEWGELLRQAFVARGLLERHEGHRARLSDCTALGCITARAGVRELLAGSSPRYLHGLRSYPWPDELERLERARRRALHDDGRPLSSSAFMNRLEAGEAGLLARAFQRISASGSESSDPGYEKLFLQYLRMKAAVFGLLVHPPGEHGLKNFLDHFLQIKVYAPDADSAIPSRPNEPGLNVRATEYRIAPDAWFAALGRRGIERSFPKSASFGEVAWLIHFKREEAGEGIPLHAAGVRRMEGEGRQIANLLDAIPTRLRRLRGIDICGVEEDQPCWVVADTLRTLRKRSQAIAGRDPHLRLEPLRLTLHAGEDFQWLTSGVRAIAEPFIWRLIERGDRIGHGIATTMDPANWWHRRSRDVFKVKRFDRLLDLAFLAEYVEHPTRDQIEWLRRSITAVVRDLRIEPGLFLKPSVIDIDVVDSAKRLWKTLGSGKTRTIMDRSAWSFDASQRHETWIHRYLWSRSIQKLAADEIPMTLEDDRQGLAIESDRNERDLLVKARKRLITEMARWQVCIESNPSSNLVVGSLDGMMAQDFLHRRPTSPADQEGEETLTWTISTDDPITFSTTLADEYAYAWAGMVLRKDKPYDPAYARALLDEAAATSMRTRFTIASHGDERESGGKRHGTRTRRHH